MDGIDLVEQFHKAERLAENILTFSRNILMVNLRFMDVALTQLRFRPGNTSTLATDGTVLEYGLRNVLLQFKEEQEAVTRDLLHVVLHCVFRHMYIHTLVDKPRWDLACDITVENIINELGLEDTHASRQSEQMGLIETLKSELDGLTAEKIYRYYLDLGISDTAVIELRRLFYADDHSVWYLNTDQSDEGTEEGYSSEGGLSDGGGEASQRRDASKGDDSDTKGSPQEDQSADGNGGGDHNESLDSGSGGSGGGNEGQEGISDGGGSEDGQGEKNDTKGSSPNASQDNSTAPSDAKQGGDPQNENADKDGENDTSQAAETPTDRDLNQTPRHRADVDGKREAAASEQQWKDLSETIRQDLENFSKRSGSRAGSLLQNLRAVNRERYDYGEFLKKFAVPMEVMQVNDDEFDYIFYTYGLQLLERVPLIEPLEYREAKRIRDFVIAIDTSGSVSGELVQTFIRKTYNILKTTESFSSKINLHIIQCDAQVQSDINITDGQELEAYLKTMQITGLGGTDFRPVFAHVNELVAKQAFTKLCGLLYFTDGYGAFPEKMPGYRTAFIFIDDNDNNPVTPSWAIRLVLHQDEL